MEEESLHRFIRNAVSIVAPRLRLRLILLVGFSS